MPVGVFDSGLGGMSVLRELVNLMPNEDFIYFGDSANAPYGTKSADTVRALTLKNFEYLYSLGIKAFVIACNTATSVAVATLRERYKDVEIIGVEPAASPLITKGKAGPHKLQGIGANFVPTIFDSSATDEIITAEAKDAYALVKEMGNELGIGVGISSGAALYAGIEIAKRSEAAGKTVVIICPDGIDRYLSTDLFE
jgi:glutamate racemase